MKGSKRFLDRVWNLAESASDSYDVTPANEAVIHKTIKKVTEDVDSLKMNTAIAAMMTMVNELNANGCTRGDLKYLLLLLNPFAPTSPRSCGRTWASPPRRARCAARRSGPWRMRARPWPPQWSWPSR